MQVPCRAGGRGIIKKSSYQSRAFVLWGRDTGTFNDRSMSEVTGKSLDPGLVLVSSWTMGKYGNMFPEE